MRRVRALALVGVAAAAACPDATWLEAENGKCYTLLDGASTRSQAECAALCGENVNASIVTIRSPAENAIAAALVDDAAFAWIGFYVMMAGEKRVWGRWASASTSDDAGDAPTFTKWAPGFPRNGCGAANCAAINSEGDWVDRPCVWPPDFEAFGWIHPRCMCEYGDFK